MCTKWSEHRTGRLTCHAACARKCKSLAKPSHKSHKQSSMRSSAAQLDPIDLGLPTQQSLKRLRLPPCVTGAPGDTRRAIATAPIGNRTRVVLRAHTRRGCSCTFRTHARARLFGRPVSGARRSSCEHNRVPGEYQGHPAPQAVSDKRRVSPLLPKRRLTVRRLPGERGRELRKAPRDHPSEVRRSGHRPSRSAALCHQVFRGHTRPANGCHADETSMKTARLSQIATVLRADAHP